MRVLPRSLRGRTLLLTAAGIIACEAVTFGILGIWRHTLLAGRAREFVSGQIEMVRNALAVATPEQVAQELDRPRQRDRSLIVPRPPGSEQPPRPRDDDFERLPPDARPGDDPGARVRGTGPARAYQRMRLFAQLPPNASEDPPDDLALPQIATALREEYGADALRFTADPEALWVRMPHDDWWLMLPIARYASPPLPWSILFATLAAVSLMGGIVGLYVFRLARPLRALADAAASFKIGQHPALALTGPDEIRAVTAQFNAMAERLERDDAERRVMLAGLPHDLRAPLSRAKLRLEMMDDGPDSPKLGLQRDLKEVDSIADQFVAYLRGLDRDKSGFRSTALNELVRDRGLVWRESGHDVTIARADPFTRDADADALTRAVDNLIGNAFAHGAAPVSVAGVRHDDSSYGIVITDHGSGIPEAQRELALQPFTRLDSARGASGHCGLGLAVTQSIARLHGGRIALDESPGGGLAATILLPAS